MVVTGDEMNPSQSSSVKFHRGVVWVVVVILALGLSVPARAESRATFYALQMDPRGSGSVDEAGWGFGSLVAIPLDWTQEIVKLTAGIDMGNLDFEVSEATQLGSNFVTTQDYQRLFGGAEIGRKLDARIRPHFGVNVVLLRQDLTAHFLDTSGGELIAGSSDSSTRLSYDLSAGLGIGITQETGLDVGVRFIDGIEAMVPRMDGSLMTTRPDYLQFYVGLTRRFAWPQGQ